MNKNRIRKTTLLMVFLISLMPLFAQKSPIKFGKVSDEELKMTVYDKDSSALAVVLCDYGKFDPENIQFSRHCRIKILKKEGTSWGSINLRVPQDLGSIRARTYNLENGKVVVSKMKNESIYRAYTNGQVSEVRFSLPNVKKGSVIEFEYSLDWLPYEWRFQQEIPVIWSELVMRQHEYIKIQKIFFGYESLDIVENGRWVAKDVPAFRKEPYMSSINNYITKFEFEVREINYPGSYKEEVTWRYVKTTSSKAYYKEFTTSWEQVGKTLNEHTFFGDRISGNLFLNKFAESIGNKNISDYDKIKEAYHLIKNEVTWNLSNRIYAYSTLLETFNDKKGNSAEINLMLISLLKKMNFNANPVVLSTRENGVLSPIFPSISKLNYVVACVEIDSNMYFMDAADKYVPMGILPEKCLNGEAKIIYENSIKSININKYMNKAYNQNYQANLKLNTNGNLNGKIICIKKDYAAYDFRKELDEYSSDNEYIEELQKKNSSLYINDYKFDNIDSLYEPVKIEYDIEYDNSANIIGDNIYINPMLMEKIEENPFKSEDRKYPVDFIYPIHKTYILNLSIPEGYVATQVPESKKVSLPGNKASFIYQTALSGSFVQLRYLFIINDPIILTTEYNILKGFYDLLINKQSELIVLKKAD